MNRTCVALGAFLLVFAAEAKLDVQKMDGGYAVLRDGVRVAFARTDLGEGRPQ